MTFFLPGIGGGLAEEDKGIGGGLAEEDEGIGGGLTEEDEGIGGGLAEEDEGIGGGIGEEGLTAVCDLPLPPLGKLRSLFSFIFNLLLGIGGGVIKDLVKCGASPALGEAPEMFDLLTAFCNRSVFRGMGGEATVEGVFPGLAAMDSLT